MTVAKSPRMTFVKASRTTFANDRKNNGLQCLWDDVTNGTNWGVCGIVSRTGSTSDINAVAWNKRPA